MSQQEGKPSRKSQAPKTPVKGSVEKYLSYREAWARIKEAIKAGFYLEAVTLEESIISDRRISHLVGIGAIKRQEKLHQYPGLGGLISKWKQQETILDWTPADSCSLQTAVDDWRNRRNAVVHGMVKSHPGTPTEDIADFLELSREAVRCGEKLARAVCRWHKSAKLR
jgi:hypothetical protein